LKLNSLDIDKVLALALFMARIRGTNDVNDAATPHHFAVLADLFD
jgi:hypothetical protein